MGKKGRAIKGRELLDIGRKKKLNSNTRTSRRSEFGTLAGKEGGQISKGKINHR